MGGTAPAGKPRCAYADWPRARAKTILATVGETSRHCRSSFLAGAALTCR